MKTYSRIITHVYPHLDEIAAIRLLKKHGEGKYPGIRDAVVEYCGTGIAPHGKTWKEHEAEGTILVGIGGGPFDEHPTTEEERKIDHSACLLVAKALDVDKHPIYKRLIELVTEADLTGVTEFHIASRLKTRYRLNPTNPDKAISMINDILDDWENEQKLFVNARRDLQTMGNEKHYHAVKLPNGQELNLAVVESDNYKVGAAARSLRIPLLIQKQKNGHVQIFCDTDRNVFSMKRVAAKLRKAECLLSGMSEDKLKSISDTVWEREGKIAEAINWFYQVPGENLLNGTETTPETPPTKIPLHIIIEVVQKNVFHEVKQA
jgi:hypothetical protein